MSTKHDGGPAFPAPNWYENTPVGMTLRDYFAAKALVGLITEPFSRDTGSATVSVLTREIGITDDMPIGKVITRKLAHASYLIADAMLAAREAQS